MVGHDGALLLPGGPSSGPFPDQRRAASHRRSRPRGSHDAAEGALRRFLEGGAGGFNADPNQSVADYLTVWLAAKALVLKPTTIARYRDYVHNDLVPAFGTLKMDELGHRHIAAFVTGELAAGRGQTTLYRCPVTLSSALGAAFRQHRLAHNPARPSALHRPPSPERRIWTADEAVRFLQHCHRADPDMADLFEFLIGTGMRKGEALGLHWDYVHSCSADPTADHSALRAYSTGSGNRPTKPAFPASPSTTCDTSPPPSPSPPASHSPEPRRPAAGRTGQRGCDHHATTSSASARPSTGSAPPPRPRSALWRTSPEPGVRPHCDHQDSGHGKGRPLMDERTASDLHEAWSGRQDLNLRPLDFHRLQ
ncbi:site-specific integrase [Streptomyces sp. NBC_00069]|uniref:site-specific integrase n=1 Tax=Streptomyces sp. NBC_00069 TaxID=2975639 RepID=UPI00324F99E6